MKERRKFVRVPGDRKPHPERRKFIRISQDAQVSYTVLPERVHKGTLAIDIGEGGIKFIAHELIRKGANLQIRITIKKKIYLYLEARVKVVWVKEVRHHYYEIGVEFVSLDSQAQKNLIAYVTGMIKGE